MSVYQITVTFLEYRSEPYVTSLRIVADEPIPFPQVQICSSNPINASKLGDADGEMGQGYLSVQASEVLALGYLDLDLGGGPSKGPPPPGAPRAQDPTHPRHSGPPPKGSNASPEHRPEGDVDPMEAFLNATRMEIPEVFKACFHNGLPFDCAQEIVFQKTTLGYCYVLGGLESQLVGGTGLVLLMDVHSELGDPRYAHVQDGLYVRILKDLSPASHRNIFLPSSTSARVQLTVPIATHYSLKQCQDDMERKYQTYPYDINTCRLECSLRAVADDCGCADGLPPTYSLPALLALRHCKEDAKVNDCAQERRRRMVSQPTDCAKSCLPKCDTWDMAAVPSFAAFPSEALKRRPNNSALGVDWAGRAKDLVYVEILFEDLMFTRVSESRRMTVSAAFGQVGGNLGLWLSASVLSMVQIFTIFFSQLHERATLDMREREAEAKSREMHDAPLLPVAQCDEALRKDSGSLAEKTSAKGHFHLLQQAKIKSLLSK